MVKKVKLYFIASVFLITLLLITCIKDKGEPDYALQGYPQDVGRIIVNKCATSGCHNDESRQAAAGLSLENWNRLFEGSNSGAAVIPFRPDFSTLIYYTNTYEDFGEIHLTPTMPLNKPKLSYDEVKTLYNWVLQGSPNADGFIKFSDNLNRKKFYVANQGCDVVTIFDNNTLLAMRKVNVGITGNTEAPHMIRVSPDNQHWYVSFIGGTSFQKFRTSDNSSAGNVDLGTGSWNTFTITPDSKIAFVVDWANGKIAHVDIENMNLIQMWSGFVYPHGSAINETGDTLYVTAQSGNYITKIPVYDPGNYEEKSMQPGIMPNNGSSLGIHEILFSPDKSNYYITCQQTNEIRVVKTSNDSVIAVIPVGGFPQEIAVSASTPYLFVTCMEDVTTFPGKTGSVYVINYNTNTVVTSLYAGHQAHGVAVDDHNRRIYISNRNVTTGGPAPHHSSVCGGRNGYITAIDMNSLQIIPGFKAEVSVDPYGIGITY